MPSMRGASRPAAVHARFISSGVTKRSHWCVPLGSQPSTYSAPTIASAQALKVRLMVEKKMMPPGFTTRAHWSMNGRNVGHVLDDFQARHDIERFAARDEVLDAHRAIVDLEPLRLGVSLGDGDVARGRIDARDVGAHPRQRLGDQPAAAADVERGEPASGFSAAGIAAGNAPRRGRG